MEKRVAEFLRAVWRPLTMIAFAVMIYLSWLGVGPPIPDQAWDLMTLIMSGYVGVRSAEKITAIVKGK
jgi:hypothetical protein